MRDKTAFVVEIAPDVLWQNLPEGQRPILPTHRLDLFEDLIYVSSDAETTIGGPSVSFDGISLSLTAGAFRLLLAQRLHKLIWSPLTITGKGELGAFLDLCKGREISREELAAENSRSRDHIRTSLLYRFSRALSESEMGEFWRKVSRAVEFGESRGHTFGKIEFRDGSKVAVIVGYLKWEDREFGATLLQAAIEFDLEVCPIIGFKGRDFVNPLRATSSQNEHLWE